ncbi:expressed protein [Chlorella variabilis]|uniref:Expressed protein n=1 Tax=Chlorella variabilis TaxID=554065 RepID=E1ZF80_CHLVA|nr:expressed protein [Chlorella variabilis]EFN55454.1 expressed protein [Chlorella variabilis]|eukprot:XP_005847556.1 expressed protein [Chlorella variabilis]
MPRGAVAEGLASFAMVLGTVALLATAATACWLLLFHFALKKLPPVQEALGLKKRDKPSLAEKRHEIEALKAQHRASMNQRGSSGSMQPTLSQGDRGRSLNFHISGFDKEAVAPLRGMDRTA